MSTNRKPHPVKIHNLKWFSELIQLIGLVDLDDTVQNAKVAVVAKHVGELKILPFDGMSAAAKSAVLAAWRKAGGE
jgi:hypothetical protein